MKYLNEWKIFNKSDYIYYTQTFMDNNKVKSLVQIITPKWIENNPVAFEVYNDILYLTEGHHRFEACLRLNDEELLKSLFKSALYYQVKREPRKYKKVYLFQKIKLLRENSNNFNSDIVFETDDWMIIKPSTYESCCYWGQDKEGDSEWRVVDGAHEYYFHKDSTYIVIEKKNPLFPDMDAKYFLDFYSADFIDKEGDTIYLKEFLEKDTVLYNFFGEQIKCTNIAEKNGQYWIVINDYDFFSDYFKLDNNTRNDLISKILGGNSFEIFQYDSNDFKNITDYRIKLKPENLFFLKMILRLEHDINSEYDYDVNEVKNYYEVADIVKDNDIEGLMKGISWALCEAQEGADASAAWEDIVNKIYSFFDLEMGSAKWEKTEGFKYDALWIRFKSKSDAIRAKFILKTFDDSFEDDSKIEYSSPYNGYYGDSKEVEEGFNEIIIDKVYSAYETYGDISKDDIEVYHDYWKEEKKKNPNATDDEIAAEVQFFFDANKYNL